MLDNTEHMVFAIQFNLCKKSAIFNIKLGYQTIRIDHTSPTPPNPDHKHTMYYLAIFFLGKRFAILKIYCSTNIPLFV